MGVFKVAVGTVAPAESPLVEDVVQVDIGKYAESLKYVTLLILHLRCRTVGILSEDTCGRC